MKGSVLLSEDEVGKRERRRLQKPGSASVRTDSSCPQRQEAWNLHGRQFTERNDRVVGQFHEAQTIRRNDCGSDVSMFCGFGLASPPP